MSNILRIVLDPSTAIPTFCVVDLNRVPPIDIEHVDVSAILAELATLRREVRVVAQLREEVKLMKKMMQKETSFPPLTVISNVDHASAGNHAAPDDSGSFAALAKQLKAADFKKPKPKPVMGSSASNAHVKSVAISRCVDVFVSRLYPETTCAELVDSVMSVKNDLKVQDVNCTKLTSKFESLYSSYHVAVTVYPIDMKESVSLFMSAESWPVGVFIKRYFKKKNGGEPK